MENQTGESKSEAVNSEQGNAKQSNTLTIVLIVALVAALAAIVVLLIVYVFGDSHILITENIGGYCIFFALETFGVNRQVINIASGIDRLHMQPDDSIFNRSGGEFVTGLLVEKSYRQLYRFARFGFPDIRVDSKFDGTLHLTRIMSTVKQVLTGIVINRPHRNRP